MKTISYKGILADLEIKNISLRTNTGKIGYRISKFQIMANKPGDQTYESIVKIYSIPQSSADGIIDFSDNTLMAAAIYESNAGSGSLPFYQFAIFDQETFNQDIYITAADVNGSESINYYIELEQIQLSDLEATMATLKDIRAIES